MPAISLSYVRLPWQAQQHNLAEFAEERVASFANEASVNTDFFTDTNTLFSYLHPNTSMNRLLTVGKVYALCWFLDDFWDGNLSSQALHDAGINPEERYELISAIVATIKNEDVQDGFTSNLLEGFKYVWTEFSALAPKSWLNEFSRTMVESLITSNNSQNAFQLLKTFDDYLEMRDKDAGGIYTCLLMEFTNEAFLSAEIRNHPDIEALRIFACRIGGLGNDLVSYHKEQLQQEDGFNSLAFLIQKYDMSFEDAAMTVIEKHNELVEAFMEKEADILSSLDKANTSQILFYMQGLKEIMSGTWEWELNSMRYRTDSALFPELERGTSENWHFEQQ